jgi:hypothetical protein
VRHPGIAGQLTAALAGDTPSPVEVVLSSDGDQVFVAHASGVDTPDSRLAVAVLHDITDLKRADRVRSDFVANVSHELRTPLTAVRGYVETLLDDPSDPDQTRRFLEIVARHSSRMERLVRDLLRLARIEGGQEPLERASVAVAGLFADVQGAMAPLLETRRQRVDTHIEPGAETLDADPAKLHDVLRNLLENASAYSPEGTTIHMSCAPRRRPDSASTWRTKGLAFPSPTCRGSSNASTASTRRAARAAAPGSASPSSSTSSGCTVASSRRAIGPKEARCSQWRSRSRVQGSGFRKSARSLAPFRSHGGGVGRRGEIH